MEHAVQDKDGNRDLGLLRSSIWKRRSSPITYHRAKLSGSC
ncbi:hypothetical protein [Azospirillum melinis]